jgi:hypothetical protein
VCLGRDHLRVVRAGLVLGAIGGCDYEGEQGTRESKGQAYKIFSKITADEAELVPPSCCCLKALPGITAEWGGGDAALIHAIGCVVFVQLPAGAVGGAVALDPFGDGVEHLWVAVL